MFKKFTKTILVSALLLALLPTQSANAEDCMHDPIYDQNWTAEVTTGVRVRSIPCMETSEVLATLPVGNVVQVITETDGYYQIKMSDGREGWVGQWLIGQTSKQFNLDSQKPAVVEEPIIAPSSEPISETVTEILPDIIGHKNESAIRSLYNSGIISGYTDGYFRPDQTLTRAEMLKIVLEAKIQNFEQNRELYNNKCFNDVNADEWYSHYVCYAKENKIVNGYGDGTFRPTAPVGRAEAVKIILEVFGYNIPEAASGEIFADVNTEDWYAKYLQVAKQNGLLEETTGNFAPNAEMLRGAVSHVVNQTIQKMQQAVFM